MSVVFLTANAQSNVVLFCGDNAHFPPDHNSFTTILDSTDSGVSDLLADVNSHKFSDIMVGKPYITASYDGSNITANLFNPQVNMSTQATIAILGTPYTVNITNNQIVFPIKFHPSVVQSRVNAAIKVEGFPYIYLEIGGNNGVKDIQIYKDSTDTYTVAPLKSSDLASYWQNKLVDMSWSQADLATITGLLAHVLFYHVVPSLNLQLTADEKNGLNDIQTNIIPNIVSDLSAINPTSGVADIHYSSYKLHLAQAKQAMDSYTNDRNEILKYATLK